MSVPRGRRLSIAMVAAVIAVVCVLLSAPVRRLLFIMRPPGAALRRSPLTAAEQSPL